MKTEKVKLSELRNPEKNVRYHPPKQIQEIIRSVKMFGQIRPIVVDENNVILAGNGLYEALKEMGETEASVLRVTGLTDKQKKKLMLADNKVYSLGVDDNDTILEILAELKDELDVPGFDDDLLRDLLADFEETEERIVSYGKLDEEEIQEFRRAAERKEAIMEKAAQAEAEPEEIEEDVEEDVEPVSHPSPGSHYAAEESSYPRPAESRHTIRCPHCGGMIEL